ncbi:MAG: glycosyltransferase family 61 protein [Verrucomicrobiota bacterium]
MFLNSNKIKTIFKRGLLKSLKEFIYSKAIFIVPWNQHYRPTGIVDIHSNPEGVDVQILREGIVSETYVPKPMHDVMIDKGYDLNEPSGDHIRMYSRPTTALIASVKNGRVYTDNLKTSAIITEGNKLLTEVSFQYVTESTTEEESLIFKQRSFPEVESISGTVFVMIAGGVSGRGNYFHWLVDVVPRLQLLKDSGLASKVDKYLVPQYKSDFQKTTLRLLGVDESKVIECTSSTHLQCDVLMASSHPRGRKSVLIPDWVFSFYQEQKKKLLVAGEYPKRMYVTRKDSSLRGILDEDRLIEYLAQHGFEPITLAEHDFDGKVNLFSNADMIISAHGAGLTNLFFSNPESRLLELFTEGFVDPVLMNLAERNKVIYDYIIFPKNNAAHEDAKGQYEDIIVDYELLENKLKTFLS